MKPLWAPMLLVLLSPCCAVAAVTTYSVSTYTDSVASLPTDVRALLFEPVTVSMTSRNGKPKTARLDIGYSMEQLCTGNVTWRLVNMTHFDGSIEVVTSGAMLKITWLLSHCPNAGNPEGAMRPVFWTRRGSDSIDSMSHDTAAALSLPVFVSP